MSACAVRLRAGVIAGVARNFGEDQTYVKLVKSIGSSYIGGLTSRGIASSWASWRQWCCQVCVHAERLRRGVIIGAALLAVPARRRVVERGRPKRAFAIRACRQAHGSVAGMARSATLRG